MGPTALLGTIYRSHCTISTNIYLYLQYFQNKRIPNRLLVCVWHDEISQHILLLSLFLLLFMGPLHFLVLLMGFIVLFQLTFIFIYSTSSKKFSISAK